MGWDGPDGMEWDGMRSIMRKGSDGVRWVRWGGVREDRRGGVLVRDGLDLG